MPLLNLRNRFPLLASQQNKDLAYLDNAASTQKPDVVLAAMDEFQKSAYANVHRGVYKIAEEATAAYEGTRQTVAKFLNAREPAEIIFTKNATESLNLVAQSYAQLLRPGDGVLLTQMEHHSNLVPWQQVAKRYKLKLEFVPVADDGRLDMATLDKLLGRGVKVVSISAMSNVLGTIPDLPAIIERAHEVGAIVIVDAAQAVPHQPFDVQALGCDFLAFTGHKIFGPSGIGALYGKRALLEAMPPFLFGGHMINEVQWHDSTWAELPSKFEAGTPPITEVVGLGAAITFVNELGWSAIQKHEAELATYALSALMRVPSLKIIGPTDALSRGPVFSFTVEGVHAHDLASVLDEANVAVRAGHHCAQPLHRRFGLAATTRASFSIYNTKEEVDRLVAGIERAQKLFT